MSISTKLYSILQTVFGNEIYPVIHPDYDGTEISDLFAIYSSVGGQSFNSLQSTDTLQRPRMQISIYGINFDEVVLKEAATISAMNTANTVAITAIKNKQNPLTVTGALPNVLVGSPIDGYEKDTKRFVKHLEFYCWVQ